MALYYSLGFLALFFVCLILEFFVPSAGLIGVAAFVAAVVAILSAFGHSVFAGSVVSSIVVVSTPAILYFMIRMWPHTPIGRRILNRKPGQRFDRKEQTLRDGTPMVDLIGQVGVAVTDLLPSGRVLIEGRKLDAVSIGMPIDAGSDVVVTKIVARKIQVRIADAADVPSTNDFSLSDASATEETQSKDTTGDAATGQQKQSPSALESFDLESLD